ncbi:MAG: putative phosphosugar-binding protein [Natronomonas sp.]|jgi:uncharacterized phosphosugar-binding protein
MAHNDPSEESDPGLAGRAMQYARNEAPESVRGEAVYELADVLVCTGAAVGVAILIAHALGLGRFTTTLAVTGVALVGVVAAVAMAVRTAIRAVHTIADATREEVRRDARRYRRR